ncbi:MAG: hypothetical protein JWM85_214 [Acidimicrobiaceae bacterium]|nr:hypothetical protein [Acidimicrobiaceae bacterium]
MAERNELLEAIGGRLLEQLGQQGTTSDTILKLAEAWAWIAAPDQPHGGYHAS